MPADSSNQPSVISAVGSRGASPHDIGNCELELVYSGESDGITDSKKTVANTEPDVAKPEPTKSDSRSAFSLTEHRDIFGSLVESDSPSPRSSRSLQSE